MMDNELEKLKEKNKELEDTVRLYQHIEKEREKERVENKKKFRGEILVFVISLVIILLWLNSIGYTWDEFLGRN
ncbi:MAG: hypothetical protein O2950_05900 [Proteobacteria bacterium]|nr:hypothetical protein [Pseudomonadota bacterium]